MALSRDGTEALLSQREWVRAGHHDEAKRLGIAGRLEHARAELERVSAPEYLASLVGTIGADPVHRPLREPGGDGQGVRAARSKLTAATADTASSSG